LSLGRPPDLATRATVEFFVAHVPSPSVVLEVGCGFGDVAAALQRLGHSVTGIDPGIPEVGATRARGVPAICGTWPEVSVPAADVVLFTRSLHHVADLEASIVAARRALNAEGMLLIEDFDYGSADARTVTWLRHQVERARAAGLTVDADEFATRIAAAEDPLEAWRTEHDEHLHTAAAIMVAVSRHFTIHRATEAPYLYRYLIPILEDTARAANWLETLYENEKKAEVPMIGRRIVAA
jgi:SAM-dependent methyltransferase